MFIFYCSLTVLHESFRQEGPESELVKLKNLLKFTIKIKKIIKKYKNPSSGNTFNEQGSYKYFNIVLSPFYNIKEMLITSFLHKLLEQLDGKNKLYLR